MTPENPTFFEPRRSFRQIWILMAGFGMFIPIGIVMYLISGAPGALWMAALALLPVLYLLYRVLSPGSGYSISETEIVLKNGGARRRIPLGEISGAAVLSQEEAHTILQTYEAPAVEGQRQLDLNQWYRSNKAYGEFIRFCTVPVVQQHISAGHSLNIIKFGAKVGGKFVLLKLSSGQEYLISPLQSDALFQRLTSTGLRPQ